MVCFETANHFYLSHKSSIRAAMRWFTWRENRFAEACSLQICRKIMETWEVSGKRWQIPHLPPYLQSCEFGMQMWHLSSLFWICSSVFAFLRHVCREQICANPFFLPVIHSTNQAISVRKKKWSFFRMKFIDSPVSNLNVITTNLRPRSIFVPFVK